MRYSNLDFNSIERALTISIEALELEGDEQSHHQARQQLTNAQEELKRALSFSMSRINGQ